MWVKICANTNVEDSLAAVELGADAVGFVFAPSKRQVPIEQAREITHRLPASVERVGVFADRNIEAILNTVKEAHLTAVQLHGGLDLEFAGRLRERLGETASIIHVVHWEVSDGAVEAASQLQLLENARLNERVLIDAKAGNASGGLGVSFNWTEASALLKGFHPLRIIVAGGLRPENVAEAVNVFRPYGVDVASGVELAPGRKDLAKVKAFISEARHWSGNKEA